MNDLRMELKVCEGCGALWLRAGGSGAGMTLRAPVVRETLRNDVYCKPCVRLLAAMPAPRGPKKNSRIRIRVRNRKPLVALTPVASLGNAGGAR